MFHRKSKQVLPVVGITVPHEWYNEKVAECDRLKANVDDLLKDNTELELQRKNAFAAYNQQVEQVSNQAQVIKSLVNRQTELKQELEEWKAKAQHRKVKAKAVE